MLTGLLKGLLVCSGIVVGLSSCAALRVTLTPEKPAPICDAQANALVLWAPQWRSDQKDIPQREAAAESGIQAFLNNSGCFATAELRRVSALPPVSLPVTASGLDKVVTLKVRELGPVLKLFASLALIDGGTEVVLDIGEYRSSDLQPVQTLAVHWEQGGPGVIKGVETLPQDMQAALKVGLQPH